VTILRAGRDGTARAVATVLAKAAAAYLTSAIRMASAVRLTSATHAFSYPSGIGYSSSDRDTICLRFSSPSSSSFSCSSVDIRFCEDYCDDVVVSMARCSIVFLRVNVRDHCKTCKTCRVWDDIMTLLIYLLVKRLENKKVLRD
jgi:hypothetical protein